MEDRTRSADDPQTVPQQLAQGCVTVDHDNLPPLVFNVTIQIPVINVTVYSAAGNQGPPIHPQSPPLAPQGPPLAPQDPPFPPQGPLLASQDPPFPPQHLLLPSSAQLQPGSGGDQVIPTSDSESDMDVEEAGFYDGGSDAACGGGQVPQQ